MAERQRRVVPVGGRGFPAPTPNPYWEEHLKKMFAPQFEKKDEVRQCK